MDKDVSIALVPLIFCVLDVLTGYIAAARRGELNSTIMRDGLWNKSAELCAIVLAKATEFCINTFGIVIGSDKLNMPICTAICAYISLYELTSCIENIGKMNPDIGKWLIEHVGFDSYKVGLYNNDTWTNDEDVK